MSDSTSTASAAPPAARRNNPMRGIAFLCAGAFAFSVHDIGVKWVSGDYPLSQVLFIRSATAAPLILLMVVADVGIRGFAVGQVGLLLVRSLILLIGYFVYYLGLSAMQFADAVALYMSVPLIIVALSGPFLGERVGLLRWLAVVAGFCGVVVMLQPGRGVLEPAAALVLLCAFLYSCGMVIGRRLGATVPATVMSFYSNGLFLVASIGIGLVFNALQLPQTGHPSIDFLTRPWIWPSLQDLLVMMSCGVTAALGIAGLTFAYREAEANLVASFEYTALVWAVMWGFLVWGDIPKTTTLAGAALIVGAGLVALLAGQRRAA